MIIGEKYTLTKINRATKTSLFDFNETRAKKSDLVRPAIKKIMGLDALWKKVCWLFQISKWQMVLQSDRNMEILSFLQSNNSLRVLVPEEEIFFFISDNQK